MPREGLDVYAWLQAVWCDESPLDSQEGAVMMALVRHADGVTGECYPGIGRLAACSKVSRSKVIRSLAVLEEHGMVARERRTRGSGHASNLYRVPLTPPAGSVSQTPVSGPREGLTSVSQTLPVVSPRHLGSVSQTPELSQELTQGTLWAEPTSKPAKRKRPEAPIPADWQPTDAHRAFASKRGLDLELEAAAFRGYFDGKPIASPNGRFTTWLANSVKWGRNGRGKAPPPQRGVAASVRTGTLDDWGDS